MERPTYRISTLGCRVNHAEARDLESTLLQRGFCRADRGDPADLEVVHTCSVTRTAAAKSRNAIRRAARRSLARSAATLAKVDSVQAPAPELLGEAASPMVIVTGCYASTDPKDSARASGEGPVIPQSDADGSPLIARFAREVDQWQMRQAQSRSSIRASGAESSARIPLPLVVTPPQAQAGGHVRAELRIQDGCDAHCSFCIIPKIRKRLRSKRIADVVAEATRLVDLGHQEIVLTGIFIGAYGHETALRRKQANRGDFRGASPLADLLDSVAQIAGLQRLRISSMEPGDVSETLLDAMVANAPVVVPHLHLPLQSGSNEVLRRMNRQYGVGEYVEMIDQVNAALTTEDGLPPAITTDIICGFPGETEEDFEKTIQVAQAVGYLHMHVFPYSPRESTAAARWTDLHHPPLVVKGRVRRLIDLEEAPEAGLAITWRRRLLNRTVRVILEQPDRDHPGRMTGRCDHYDLITIPTDRPRGMLLQAHVTEVNPHVTLAQPAPAHEATSVPLTVLH